MWELGIEPGFSGRAASAAEPSLQTLLICFNWAKSSYIGAHVDWTELLTILPLVGFLVIYGQQQLYLVTLGLPAFIRPGFKLLS